MTNNETQKILTRNKFSDVTESHVKIIQQAKGEDLKLILVMTKPRPDWIMLDIATGEGHTTALTFSPFVSRVIAIDLCKNALEVAQTSIQKKGINNIFFQYANAESLPFDSNIFDLVTCRIASHHFSDCLQFVKESVRVLKNNGHLFIQDRVLPENIKLAAIIDNFERLRDPDHYKVFSKNDWTRMFEIAELKVKCINEVVKRRQLIPWAKRQKCSNETIEKLFQIIKTADTNTKKWMQPENLDNDNDNVSFMNHHILILGKKDDDF